MYIGQRKKTKGRRDGWNARGETERDRERDRGGLIDCPQILGPLLFEFESKEGPRTCEVGGAEGQL